MQKQKTSGFSDAARVAASVEVWTSPPSSALAFARRPSSMSQMPVTSKRSLDWKADVWCPPR